MPALEPLAIELDSTNTISCPGAKTINNDVVTKRNTAESIMDDHLKFYIKFLKDTIIFSPLVC
ncbi:hypothetical protein D3C87_1594690 [compost metagenome]